MFQEENRIATPENEDEEEEIEASSIVSTALSTPRKSLLKNKSQTNSPRASQPGSQSAAENTWPMAKISLSFAPTSDHSVHFAPDENKPSDRFPIIDPSPQASNPTSALRYSNPSAEASKPVSPLPSQDPTPETSKPLNTQPSSKRIPTSSKPTPTSSKPSPTDTNKRRRSSFGPCGSPTLPDNYYEKANVSNIQISLYNLYVSV